MTASSSPLLPQTRQRSTVRPSPRTLSSRPVDRLRRRADFTAALRSGKRARRGALAIAVRPNDWGQTRVGYAVGRRVGGAVVRNRVRRRLRALIDELLAPLAAEPATAPSEAPPFAMMPFDIVITAFAEAVGASFEVLRRDLASALRAVGVECAEPRS